MQRGASLPFYSSKGVEDFFDELPFRCRLQRGPFPSPRKSTFTLSELRLCVRKEKCFFTESSGTVCELRWNKDTVTKRSYTPTKKGLKVSAAEFELPN